MVATAQTLMAQGLLEMLVLLTTLLSIYLTLIYLLYHLVEVAAEAVAAHLELEAALIIMLEAQVEEEQRLKVQQAAKVEILLGL
jgi:hypothetical protein